ncbi:MAG: heavy-metal-associated domain-containing protein [Chloroflexaceae bacterium]|nr:heavy-metal-associated domain-containing protein [Chloroflexaceae bacterium]
MGIRILPLALLTAASFGVAPLAAQGQIVRAIASIDGITCPFCAFGAEKQLKQVGGVQRIAVDVDKGTATLVARAGQSIEVGQIPGAVKAAGFTAREVRIVAIGTVIAEGQGLRLQLQGQPRRLTLRPSRDEALMAKLRAASGQRTLLEVTGVWNEGGDALIPEAVKGL